MSAPVVISRALARETVSRLTECYAACEAACDPAWYDMACAAVMLDALTLGLAVIEPIDPAPAAEARHE